LAGDAISKLRIVLGILAVYPVIVQAVVGGVLGVYVPVP
jgi:hypothetical protein